MGRKTLLERFEEKYIPVTESGCWLWCGASDKTGYGRIRQGNRTLGAHRISYMLFKGELKLPAIDHLCRVPLCVNPDHLENVTTKTNNSRAIRVKPYQNSLKTKCPHGHNYVRGNVYVDPKGSRRCRICIRRQVREWVISRK